MKAVRKKKQKIEEIIKGKKRKTIFFKLLKAKKRISLFNKKEKNYKNNIKNENNLDKVKDKYSFPNKKTMREKFQAVIKII